MIVELGSGAGRFTEILLSSHSYVISVEMSNAIHVNALNNKSDKIFQEVGENTAEVKNITK